MIAVFSVYGAKVRKKAVTQKRFAFFFAQNSGFLFFLLSKFAYKLLFA